MGSTATPDAYYAALDQWSEELNRFRELVLSAGLEESIKWGGPCYTLDGKLVVGISGFKHHFALWFHQGALLGDPEGKLVNAQEGRTRALRQWRFVSEPDPELRAD